MTAARPGTRLLVILAFLVACGAPARAPSESGPPGLAGTAWQLVKLQAGDGTSVRPDDPAK